LPSINEFFGAESRCGLVVLALIKPTNNTGFEKRVDLNDLLGGCPCFRGELLDRRSASITSRKRVLNHFNSERSHTSRLTFKLNRVAALAEWRLLCSA